MNRITLYRRARIAGLCSCAIFLSGMAGCYERVVGASGFGGEQSQVYKPNGPGPKGSSTFTYKKSTTKDIPAPGSPQE